MFLKICMLLDSLAISIRYWTRNTDPSYDACIEQLLFVRRESIYERILSYNVPVMEDYIIVLMQALQSGYPDIPSMH